MIRKWLTRRRRDADWEDADWERADWERVSAVQLYRPEVDALSAILFHHDPVGINLEENTDEYDAEAERIILTLATTPKPRSVEQLQDMIHRVFVQCFGEKTAGPAPRYRPIAQEVWARRGNWPGGAPDSALPPPDPPARV
jgi:hypothetical protein